MGMSTPDALAARRAGLSQQHSPALGFGDALMDDQMAGIELDLDFVFVSSTSTRRPI
jgi:hypothetical protein